MWLVHEQVCVAALDCAEYEITEVLLNLMVVTMCMLHVCYIEVLESSKRQVSRQLESETS